MSWPEPGIHFGVSEADYHAIGHAQGVVSKSLLWKFAANPHKWRFGAQQVNQTDSMRWGSLVDCLTLTPSAFDRDFVVSQYDEYRTNEAKAWRDEQTRTVVKRAERDEAYEAVDAIWNHSIAAGVLENSTRQVSVIADAVEPVTGEPFRAKCRLDIVPDAQGEYSDWLFDLKTCQSLHKIEHTIADFGYHVQAALYLDLWNKDAAAKRTRWGFIFQESESPYEVAVVELAQPDIHAGREWYQAALAKWCRCERDQNWPSPWEDEIKVVSRPAWARKGDEA
jgi:hypothetical protein